LRFFFGDAPFGFGAIKRQQSVRPPSLSEQGLSATEYSRQETVWIVESNFIQ
jgi:hypothetical protein